MVITTSIETLDGSWIYCYTSCILGRASRTNETLPDFCENMDSDKWDITVWYRVIRNPQEFRGLKGCQWDPRVLGRHIYGLFGVSFGARFVIFCGLLRGHCMTYLQVSLLD